MKKLCAAALIVTALLLSCPGADTDSVSGADDADYISALAGAPKAPEQWGTLASSIPNNIGIAISGETTRTITWQSTLARGEVLIGSARYPSTSTLHGRSFHHRVEINGLEAGGTYWYIAGSTDSYSPAYSFKIEKTDSARSFSVLHVTDPQIGSSGKNADDAAVWRRVLESAVRKCPGAAFIVNTGDIVENADETIIPYYFDYAQEFIAEYAFVYSMGNNDSSDWYNVYFHTPDTGNGGVLYSFDYGNAHFVNVDSNIKLSSAQLKWLENDLKNTAKKWKVAMTHEADYGRSGSNTALTKLFDKYNVDLVMAGHNHFYARSKPIDTAGNAKHNGTVWTIPNTAGTKFNEASGGKYLAVDKQPKLPMFSELEFTESNIFLKAYTVGKSGTAVLFDSYSFR